MNSANKKRIKFVIIALAVLLSFLLAILIPYFTYPKENIKYTRADSESSVQTDMITIDKTSIEVGNDKEYEPVEEGADNYVMAMQDEENKKVLPEKEDIAAPVENNEYVELQTEVENVTSAKPNENKVLINNSVSESRDEKVVESNTEEKTDITVSEEEINNEQKEESINITGEAIGVEIIRDNKVYDSEWMNETIEKNNEEIADEDLESFYNILVKLDLEYIADVLEDESEDDVKEKIREYMKSQLTDEEYKEAEVLFKKYNYMIFD